jgi:peptidoglycan/LPS O-acetylase OafA/YrhL
MKTTHLNQDGTIYSIGKYYPALDGLRGLAILMIIAYHNFGFLNAYFNFGSLNYFTFGWTSLDLFFVLSGFLITGILFEKRDSPRFMVNFYTRRVLRIFPVYYLSLVIFLFVLPKLIAYPFGIQYFIINQYWFWFEIQNWLFILKPAGNNNFLNHFWSLALEEQFYLLSPWLILFIRPVQRMINFILVVMLFLLFLRLALWYLQLENVSYIDIYAFTRIDGLCVGSLLALLRYQGGLKISRLNYVLGGFFLFLVFIAIPSFKFFHHFILPYKACCIFPAVAIFWGSIVWFSLTEENLICKIFNNRVLIYFGRISYCLYILHWPIYRLLSLGNFRWFGTQNTFETELSVSVISALLATILATVSFYTFERYFLRFKEYFT